MSLRLGILAAFLVVLPACAYEPAFELTCEEGQQEADRVCEDGVWISTADSLDAGPNADVRPDGGADPDTGEDAGCVPETDAELCATVAAECGTLNTVTDRCGVSRSPTCGTCAAPDECGPNNRCACVVETPAEFCQRLGKDCGTVSAADNCGQDRTYACGTCEGGVACGDEQPNVCGCPCNIDGICYPEGARNGANACEVCDPASSEIAWTVATGASCDDGDACTENDVCDAGAVCAGTTKDCSCDAPGATHCSGLDQQCVRGRCSSTSGACVAENESDGTACSADSLSCTDDVCRGGTCTASISATSCLIAGTCYAAGETNGPCQTCAPTNDRRNWTTNVGVSCDSDQLSCTSQTCNAAAQCEQTVNAGSCLVAGTCYASGDGSPGNSCAVCDPAQSTTSFSNAVGTSCSDGRSCTSGDMCQAGACMSGTVDAGKCFIAGACFNDSDPNPNGALFCLSCDAAADKEGWSIDPTTCFIGGDCIADGAADPNAACQVCDPSIDQSSYSPASNGTACGAGCGCQGGECLKNSNGTPCG